MKEVKHIDVREGMKVSELVSEMKESGVMGAGKIAEAVDIFKKMKEDKDCKIFFGLAGAMVPGGMKKIIISILNSFSDRIVFVTTGANLTHDLIEALGERHYQGTEKAVQKLAQNITGISAENIGKELMKSASMSGDKFAKYIELLDKFKLLKFILPEVMNLKWYKENLHHHPETRGKGGTVYSHVMAALKKSDTADPIKNLAILLHDVGKGVTLSHEKGLPRYLGHARKSVELVNAIADRLRMSNKDKEALVFAVGNHMKFHKILDMKPSKIAKIVSDDNWDVLVAVGKADEFARGHMFMHKGEFEKIVDKAIKVKEKFGAKQVNKQVKMVDGKDVMRLTGLKPGPEVGKVITQTTAWILDNDIEDKEEIENYIRRFAK